MASVHKQRPATTINSEMLNVRYQYNKIILETFLFVASEPNVALCYTHRMSIKFTDLILDQEKQNIILTWQIWANFRVN